MTELLSADVIKLPNQLTVSEARGILSPQSPLSLLTRSQRDNQEDFSPGLAFEKAMWQENAGTYPTEYGCSSTAVTLIIGLQGTKFPHRDCTRHTHTQRKTQKQKQ